MKFTLTFLALLLFNTYLVKAHSDFYIIKDYENVKVRVKAGYDLEEINKAFIIGQLTERLTKEKNYKAQIFLDFTHYYLGDRVFADYFISFDKGLIIENTNQSQKTVLEDDAIVIRQISNEFNVENTLKLVEYSIDNLQQIQTQQKEISYHSPYHNWKQTSINPTIIEAIINNEQLSPTLRKIYSTKIYRPNDDFKFGFTYYWKDGKFLIIKIDLDGNETQLIELDNLYDFRFVDGCVFVFPSKKEFFTLNETYNRKYKSMVSDLLTITDGELNHKPYKIESIGGYKYSIYFKSRKDKSTYLIYDEVKNNLIELEE